MFEVRRRVEVIRVTLDSGRERRLSGERAAARGATGQMGFDLERVPGRKLSITVCDAKGFDLFTVHRALLAGPA